ncbi:MULTISPECIES: EAL domain-containing protein [unclassified Novosphingobium]|uniref:bifunctional diguanylate cyclase/phosphodiesterase n=1 Tax=unclassified Novosphingobium TaxID=2644732 RepID=UPI00135ADEDA|nr:MULTISPECIES: EAL domain-containing protein [unclassified Novosphingobium]
MFDVLLCIHDQHNEWFVLLAAVICVISTMSAVQLIRHARHLSGKAAARWTIGAGLAIGFGIWATHFVAMLGYDPGLIAGYQIPATALSLIVAIAMTTMSFATAMARPDVRGLTLASLLGGGGIAAMHYLGMSALELPAQIHWRSGYVVASLFFVVLPTYPALALAVRGRTMRGGIAAGLLLTLSVVLLHFIGMTAVQLVPASLDMRTGVLLSRGSMAAMITAGSLCLLTTCIAVLAMARRARLTLHATERDMSILVKGITDCAIYMLDRDGKVANWNAGAQRLKGYAASEVIGMPLERFYTPEDRAEGLPKRAMTMAMRTGKYVGEGWRMRRDGTRFWAHVTIEKIADENGDHIGFAKITRDMDRFKEDADRLKAMTGHLDAALGNMHQGLCLFGADKRLLLVNARFTEIWKIDLDVHLPGMTIEQVARTALNGVTCPAGSQRPIDEMRRLFARPAVDTGTSPEVLEFGDTLVVSMISRTMPDGGWVTTFEDITERRRSDAKIAHMAMHDSLTGLPNRSSFAHWIDAELEQARHFGHQLTSVMIDLDRFKEINDTRGHSAGDAALQHLSKRLLDVLTEGEVVARLGGDEFAAAKRFKDKAELATFLARLENCFATPFGPEDNSFYLGASIGVAVFPQDGDQREQLLNNADLAMYRAKANVGERLAYYEPEMDETARARRQIANDLRHALDRNELTLVYQPQHGLATGEMTGYEALLRWEHPVRGFIAPDDFIPIAEETGEIFRIGEWVLRQACIEAMAWPNDLKIAVNLSAVQLSQSDLVQVVHGILIETGLSPKRLELEITETAIIGDKLRALHLLRQIKALGISIAMDDFGTGYSSLDTLHSFPFDKIKIDKSFLLRSQTSVQARAIIKAVLALGRSLNVPVLAEGVETLDQVALLKEQGCDEAQGYYFGRPAASPSQSVGHVAITGSPDELLLKAASAA